MTRTFCDQCDCLLEDGKQRVKLDKFEICGVDKRGKGFTLAASGIFCSTFCAFTQVQGMLGVKAPNFDEHCQKRPAAPTPKQPFVLPADNPLQEVREQDHPTYHTKVDGSILEVARGIV